MLHFGNRSQYDDDDDDFFEEDEDDYKETNDENTNPQKSNFMNNWLKRNWFITLRIGNEMRHISFISIVEVNTKVEGQKHFLNFVTSVGTYKCGMPAMQCLIYTSMFHDCGLNRHDLHNIMCDSVEFIKSN